MKRWATHLFIASYLGLLGFGLSSHALTFLKSAHVGMYFIVWDMYCGWSAFENRTHVIGEGDSGQYYELSPGPWGGLQPFSSADRKDYDIHAFHGYSLAANTLAQTEHEPIRRIYVVEESWSKKYNLPPALWKLRYQSEKPEDHRSYYHVRKIYNSSGEILQQSNDWLNTQFELAVLDNPRLRTNMRKGHTFYASGPQDRSSNAVRPVNFETFGDE